MTDLLSMHSNGNMNWGAEWGAAGGTARGLGVGRVFWQFKAAAALLWFSEKGVERFPIFLQPPT